MEMANGSRIMLEERPLGQQSELKTERRGFSKIRMIKENLTMPY
jgi:hypothetical protein